MMASEAGGMDIEEVAAETPEKIIKVFIDPITGLEPFHAREVAYGLNLKDDTAKQAAQLVTHLYRIFVDKDCSQIEINPLAVTKSGDVIALDAKLNFDDNALFRHPEVKALRDPTQENPLGVEASKHSLTFIHLGGNIGCMVNGAGLAMATMDIIKLSGGQPANFLDVGGGANADQVTAAFRIILMDPEVKAILINIFGGITRGDTVAAGIVEAARRIGLSLPLVVRLEGTNFEEGKRILAESGLPITPANGLKDAAEKVVAAANAAA
jgi:succinyl-CoA synthetase beta subunit